MSVVGAPPVGRAGEGTRDGGGIGRAERARAVLLAAGGILFAVGNALHPLEHNEAAESKPTWRAAHLVFALGAVLIAAGLPVLRERVAASRVGAVGYGLLWVGMVLIPANAWLEAFVAPNVDHHAMESVEDDMALVGGLYAAAFMGGVLLLGVGAWLTRALARPAAAALVLGTVLMAAAPGPGKEGYYIIPGTILLGFGLASGALPRRN